MQVVLLVPTFWTEGKYVVVRLRMKFSYFDVYD
jgi:hypothetical protein